MTCTGICPADREEADRTRLHAAKLVVLSSPFRLHHCIADDISSIESGNYLDCTICIEMLSIIAVRQMQGYTGVCYQRLSICRPASASLFCHLRQRNLTWRSITSRPQSGAPPASKGRC